MHHEYDKRFPVEIRPEDLAEAPAWALRLAHNTRFLVERIHELEQELEKLRHEIYSLGLQHEALSRATGAALPIPGE